MSIFQKREPILVHTQIGESGVIDGNLTTNDNIKIDGRVTGSVSARGSIVISPTGYVGGGLFGQNLYIEGEAEGNIVARENIYLSHTAVIRGAMDAKEIIQESGAKAPQQEDTAEEPERDEAAAVQEEPKPKRRRKKTEQADQKQDKPSAEPAQPLENFDVSVPNQTEEIENISARVIEPQPTGSDKTTAENKTEIPEKSAEEAPAEEKKQMTEEEEKEAFLRQFFSSSTLEEESKEK